MAWHARTLDDTSLRRFLERTDEARGEGATEFDVSDGLSLEEGRLVALVFQPRLRLARLRLEVAAASAAHAGTPTDPQFQATVLRTREDIPDRWVVSPGLYFSIPLSGRLGASRGLADARLASEWLAVQLEEWDVQREVGVAWVEWSAARLRLEETERFAETLRGWTEVTRELADTGEFSPAEAGLLELEEAHLGSELRALQGAVERAEQRLRSVLGLAPEAPVEFLPTLSGSDASAGLDLDALFERNAELARLRAEYEVAEGALRWQVSKQVPDLQLGPQVETEEGLTRLGFFGAGSLPFFNGNRRAIAKASGLTPIFGPAAMRVG